MYNKVFIFLFFFQNHYLFAQNCSSENIDGIILTSPPNPINFNEIKKKIHYPKILIEMGISGKYIIRVLVDSLGNIVDCKTIRSPHQILTNMYESLIVELKFQPAIKNGKAVECWINIPLDIKIK